MAWSDAARAAAAAAAAETRRLHLKGASRREHFNKARGVTGRGMRAAYFVRNKSASHQFTVLARSSKEARGIGHELVGARNKSRLSAILASKVVGYGIK